MGQKEKVILKDIPLVIMCFIVFGIGDLLRKVKHLWRK